MDNGSRALTQYRADLESFRKEFGGSRKMPAVEFFQFGMGNRPKLIFRNGALLDAIEGKPVRRWQAKEVRIVPSEYLVSFISDAGDGVRIQEDETGVWIEEAGRRDRVNGSEVTLKLPRFEAHRYGSILRVLHHEILMNVVNSRPLPNFYVYQKSWYRDGAMMGMVLKQTGNIEVIREWILGLRDPYDRNNAGETEADNLGQALFLVSLVADKNHPLVERVLSELPRFEVNDGKGVYIKGRSDFHDCPVYQTKWLKFGLRALGLPDKYAIPAIKDDYSALFWMDFREAHVSGGEADDRGRYPYLGWASDHFLNKKLSPISGRDYPLTWEIEASQADYARMRVVDPVFASEKTSVPHTWHASEVFLYLLEL